MSKKSLLACVLVAHSMLSVPHPAVAQPDVRVVNVGSPFDGVDLGYGVAFSDEGEPHLMARAVAIPPRSPDNASDAAASTMNFSVDFTEASSATSLATFLNENFRASLHTWFGSAGITNATSKATELLASSRTMYYVAQSRGEVRVLGEWTPNEQFRVFMDNLEASKLGPEEIRKRVLATYGTHIVTGVSSGFRLAIGFSSSASSQKERDDGLQAVQVAMGFFGVDAKVDYAKQQQAVQQAAASQVHLSAEFTGGQITTTAEDAPEKKVAGVGTVTFQNVGDVITFLNNVHNGKTSIKPGTTTCQVRPIAGFLFSYPNVFAAMMDRSLIPEDIEARLQRLETFKATTQPTVELFKHELSWIGHLQEALYSIVKTGYSPNGHDAANTTVEEFMPRAAALSDYLEKQKPPGKDVPYPK